MRDDLMALTAEAVAALSNMGLVKRAMKEIAEGKGPALEELPDGTVIGRATDMGKGVESRLPPRRALKDCLCNCGATTVCRHRVAVALAYRGWREAQDAPPAPSAPEPAPDLAPEPAPPPEPALKAPPFRFWTPAEIPEEALAAAIGKKALEDARKQRRKGLVVEIRLPDAEEPHPIARLPTCTVRFLVPLDLSYARCDCLIGQGCSHVALACWAFGAIPAEHRDPRAVGGRLEWTVEVRAHDRAAREWPSVEALHRLGRDLLIEGVVNARPSLSQRSALVSAALEREGAVWPRVLLEELEECLDAYRRRSARYAESWALDLLAAVAARPRAVRALLQPASPGELPEKYLTGEGERLQTPMDKVRLMSLGARIEADGRDRLGRIFLADPDMGTVLVYERAWDFTAPGALAAKEEPPDGPALGQRRAATGTFFSLARGQIVTRVAKRHANRRLLLGSNTGGAISVTPQSGDWSHLPAPLLVQSLAALSAAWDDRPPLLLRPRLQAENLHAVAVSAVLSAAYDPGDQLLTAVLTDPEGTPFLLERPYAAVAPRALDHIAAALAGRHGPLRYVSGSIQRREGRFVLDPAALVADRVIVPDLEEGEGAPLPVGAPAPPRSATQDALYRARLLLQEGAHLGLQGLSRAHPDRAEGIAATLEDVGMYGCARRFRRYGQAIRLAFAASTPGAWEDACQGWEDAAIRLMITEEAV